MAQNRLTRRRVIQLTAAAGLSAALPAHAANRVTWHGEALGAEAEIVIIGPKARAQEALSAVQSDIARITDEFNLYDPESALGRLNDLKRLDHPSVMFQDLCRAVDHVHDVTGGLFDPTVQRLWNRSELSDEAGWKQLSRSPEAIELKPGLALTFNGIAQGFATDLVAERLAEFGFGETLVNIGETRATGGPWRLGLSDPEAGYLGTRTLRSGAIATSSPGALTLSSGISHIINPRAPDEPALWSTVSIEAKTATLADGFSTALCHCPQQDIQKIIREHPDLRRATLLDKEGDLTTLR